MRLYLLIFAIAALVSGGASYIVYKLSTKYRLAPAVRERDVHSTPTPRLGGIAMFCGMLVAFAVASQIPLPIFSIIFADPGPIWAILGAALLIVVVGIADDIWDLDWMIKLGAQMLAAGLLAWQSIQIVSLPIGNSIAIASPLANFVLTVFLVVLVMNAINFIDGLDGLVAGVAIIANGVFFIYSFLLVQQTSPNNHFNLASLIAVILVGVCVGFLPFNWHKARMFMGDSGALLVGLMMAVSTISVTGQLNPGSLDTKVLLAAYIPIILPFAVMTVPLLDFSLAVIRRVQAGKSPFTADRKHLHHRLLDMGHSHLQAVLIFYAWTAVISIGFLFIFISQSFLFPLIFMGVGFLGCLAMTLAPLGRRKRTEIEVQLADVDSAAADVLAPYDPLDEASEKRIKLDD
ncbi:MraY family glycosyltransferase [Lysinibacter cavernae]|uniref:UDP-GlcNAc:undecaprenyl-phosphate GlcNAc-1-phosphate transferase n=1 Tax=Lysinibacter cavernae TaxID=1640652 RepID=A0A7X5R4T4_9MICO|nr:UDP-GlcNAc:undecaprenyl-phosphate GlcNAc-1-phosphate transferase [Lysinibacter cavernae]